uniref:Uncharacterized protein n=1 Tax=Anguilla anguilla TaxID=7936 RepID=A0A0E9WY80_ANGAN
MEGLKSKSTWRERTTQRMLKIASFLSSLQVTTPITELTMGSLQCLHLSSGWLPGWGNADYVHLG